MESKKKKKQKKMSHSKLLKQKVHEQTPNENSN